MKKNQPAHSKFIVLRALKKKTVFYKLIQNLRKTNKKNKYKIKILFASFAEVILTIKTIKVVINTNFMFVTNAL